MASNGIFIVASADSSVSVWDTVTHEQIGAILHHPARVDSMAISEGYNLVTGGGKKSSCDISLTSFPLPTLTA